MVDLDDHYGADTPKVEALANENSFPTVDKTLDNKNICVILDAHADAFYFGSYKCINGLVIPSLDNNLDNNKKIKSDLLLSKAEVASFLNNNNHIYY